MRLIGKVCVAVAATAVLYGCASAPNQHARIPFPVEEYAAYKATGDSTVSGDAVIERYNEVVTKPRNPVHRFFLLPATSYSQQAVDIAFNPCYRIAPPDPRQEQYVRRLPPMSNGTFEAKFEFKNVPAGEYYAVDQLLYEVSGSSPDGIGHRVRYQKITVTEHQNLTNVQIRPPVDTRHGGQSCRTFG